MLKLRRHRTDPDLAPEKAPREADWSAHAADRQVVISDDLIAFAGKVFDAGKLEQVVVTGDDPSDVAATKRDLTARIEKHDREQTDAHEPPRPAAA